VLVTDGAGAVTWEDQSGGGGGGGVVENWSLSEVKTDRDFEESTNSFRPIYRMMVPTGSLPNNGTDNTAHGISNVSIWTRVAGTAIGSTNSISLPHVSLGSFSVDLTVDGTNVVVVTGQDMSDYDGYVGLEYTKTTDTATSSPRFTASSAVESFVLDVGDETTALTTGTAKKTFRMPYGFTLSDVRCSVTTAPTGSAITVDINESGTTILSTKLTIDATEKTSTTAATPAVISDADLADDAEMTIDIDVVGSTIAGAGLKVYLIGSRA
jgi:hypothetical protein